MRINLIYKSEKQMTAFLGHLNFMPFMYGIVLFLSAFMIIRNIANGRIGQALGITGLLWLGFSIHGDQSETRMGVAIAALLLDMTWSRIFR
ncbi:hypothetical protein UFOVP121_65 [uncultured Caudovirales phage]|uniref:Uncharacterized protein n=1 Tax=uncultured Caudovirales phage TaxID=2100421 RepID=A0A6J5LKH1_9CAUD|nr:hypothetical protein UFOVP121_65 [uncultured Caudovirales phage]CAB4135088.1 hypothetical protein UFOVP277_70 [uncultured Caudovirales phage]